MAAVHGPKVGVARAKRRGRPRTIPRAAEVDTREEILDAAGRLFIQNGFVKTTTRQIAEAVGLQQGSLFHYFDRKQDILFALLDLVHEPPARLLAWLSSVDAPPEVKLYLLARHDSRNICSMPNNLALLYFQNEILSNENFLSYAEKREELRRRYIQLIHDGASAGCFTVDDPEVAGCLAFGLVESTCTWFQVGGPRAPDEVGRAVAESILRMLISVDADVVAIREAAERIAASTSEAPAEQSAE